MNDYDSKFDFPEDNMGVEIAHDSVTFIPASKIDRTFNKIPLCPIKEPEDEVVVATERSPKLEVKGF